MTGMTDADAVRAQYATTGRLAARAAVWGPDPVKGSPQDAIVGVFRDAAPRRLADIGCGMGAFAARAAAELPGCAVVGIDLAPAMAAATAGRGVATAVASIDELPLADASCDAVAALWMLYHVPDLGAALAQVRRVLRPGGTFVAATNGEQHLADLKRLLGRPLPSIPFSRENGADALRTAFDDVVQHDFATVARFADRQVAASYLASMDVPADALPDDGWPREFQGAATVFVCR